MIATFFIGLLTPQFIFYLSDLILFFLAVIYLRDKKYLLILFVLTLVVVVKSAISADYLVWRYLLPMLRPFIILGILTNWLKHQTSINGHKIQGWLLLTVILTSVVNVFGYIDNEYYILINNFWNGDARLLGDTGMTVASIASEKQRFSAIFAQPATAGLAFLSILYCLVVSRKHLPMHSFLLLVSAVLFCGFSSKSSFFSMGLLAFAFFNIIFLCVPIYLRSILFVLAMAAPSVLTFTLFSFDLFEIRIFGEDVLGGRFRESSYLYRLVALLNWTDYVFGVESFQKLGMRLGDNAILMRVVLAGVLFHLTYLISLTVFILKFLKSFTPKQNLASLLSFYSVISLGELGFTSFSQPGVAFLIFLPVILLYSPQVDSFRGSLNATPLTSYRSKSCAEL